MLAEGVDDIYEGVPAMAQQGHATRSPRGLPEPYLPYFDRRPVLRRPVQPSHQLLDPRVTDAGADEAVTVARRGEERVDELWIPSFKGEQDGRAVRR